MIKIVRNVAKILENVSNVRTILDLLIKYVLIVPLIIALSAIKRILRTDLLKYATCVQKDGFYIKILALRNALRVLFRLLKHALIAKVDSIIQKWNVRIALSIAKLAQGQMGGNVLSASQFFFKCKKYVKKKG
jgi:hypothetical protein